jgi:NhaP-type Na+/H+ or K+/H+ antiporter
MEDPNLEDYSNIEQEIGHASIGMIDVSASHDVQEVFDPGRTNAIEKRLLSSNNTGVLRYGTGDSISSSSVSTKSKKRTTPRYVRLLRNNKFSSFLRKHGIFPPKKALGRLLTRILVVLVWIGVLWAVLGAYIYPVPVHLNTSPSVGECGDAAVPSVLDNTNSTIGTNSTNGTSTVSCSKKVLSNLTTYLSTEHPGSIASLFDRGTLCANDESSACDVNGLLRTSCSPDIFDIEQGHFFGLIILGIVSAIFGFVAGIIRLPPLVGMLIAGVLLNNIPYIAVTRDINPRWSSIIRSVALVIILIRGGISMDANALKKLFLPVVVLGALPCIVEGGTVALLAFLLLQFGWQWALMTGYLLAAISPAVLVPSLLLLQSKKPPTADDRGLPTMMIVSGALDDIVSIALFGVFLGLTFSSGTSLALSVLRGPIEILLGLVFGVLVGVILWYLPPSDAKTGSAIRNRFFLILGFSLFALFGAQQIKVGGTGFVGAGALAILVLAFVVNLKWKKYQSTPALKTSLLMVWLFVQPFLFGLIGAAVDVYSIDLQVLGQSFALIILGQIVRLFVVFLVTLALRLPWRHQVFCCMCWIPKATVQAALVGIVTDLALQSTVCSEAHNGRLVLTLAVLEIIITAPLGATLIGIFGPALLYSQPMCAGICLRRENSGEIDSDSQQVMSSNSSVEQ